MKCFKCGTENKPELKTCRKCRHPADIVACLETVMEMAPEGPGDHLHNPDSRVFFSSTGY